MGPAAETVAEAAAPALLAEAAALGVRDEQLLSWYKHGFPGAAGMPPGVTVMGPPHVGALKSPGTFEEMNQRDISNGFVTHGQEFPHIWPCRVDPMNIVSPIKKLFV